MNYDSRKHESLPAFRAAELGAMLARHYPAASAFSIATIVTEMQSATRVAKAWEIRRCNVPMTEKQEDRGRARIDRLEEAINHRLQFEELLRSAYRKNEPHAAPASVIIGGDPRGACGRLMIPGLRGDGWGDGWSIY